jgi:gliding motility-associated-like protein
VPNAFSPNEDGNNDRFGVFAGSIRTFRMAVYNRWGEKMFETTDMQASWDGKVKDRYAPDGVYVVMIDYTDYRNRSYSTKTSVHLLR